MFPDSGPYFPTLASLVSRLLPPCFPTLPPHGSRLSPCLFRLLAPDSANTLVLTRLKGARLLDSAQNFTLSLEGRHADKETRHGGVGKAWGFSTIYCGSECSVLSLDMLHRAYCAGLVDLNSRTGPRLRPTGWCQHDLEDKPRIPPVWLRSRFNAQLLLPPCCRYSCCRCYSGFAAMMSSAPAATA